MKITNKMLSVVAAASLFSAGSVARADIFIVTNNNLDTVVANEDTASSQTEGVKNATGENNGGGTTIGPSDPGTEGYWQGFQTGPSGTIDLISLDLTVLYSTPGVNENVSDPDTATFYLYSFPNMNITAGMQIGNAIATVTAAEIETGAKVGYTVNNTSDIYQYNLISGLSSYNLAANTDYAIVMMTSSSGSQDVGWAESDTEATGDMGEFDHVNTGGNNGGAYGQMEITVVPEPTTLTLITGTMLLLFGASTLRRLGKNRTV